MSVEGYNYLLDASQLVKKHKSIFFKVSTESEHEIYHNYTGWYT